MHCHLLTEASISTACKEQIDNQIRIYVYWTKHVKLQFIRKLKQKELIVDYNDIMKAEMTFGWLGCNPLGVFPRPY